MPPTAAALADLAAFAHGLADAAGAAILPYFRSGLAVTDKADRPADIDPVTEADRNAETAMRALITARHPDHGIHGEEHGRQAGTSPYEWVLDPIDGTRGFVAGFPTWGTIVGLRHAGTPILGVVDQPWTRERWVGYPGHATLTDRTGTRPIRTRPCARLADALLSTTSPEIFRTPHEQRVLAAFQAATRLRRYGGDCYAYALLATGAVDLVVECGLYPYDVVGVIPIIEAAGGVVTTWDGGDPGEGGALVASGDPRLHAEALALLRTLQA